MAGPNVYNTISNNGLTTRRRPFTLPGWLFSAKKVMSVCSVLLLLSPIEPAKIAGHTVHCSKVAVVLLLEAAGEQPYAPTVRRQRVRALPLPGSEVLPENWPPSMRWWHCPTGTIDARTCRAGGVSHRLPVSCYPHASRWGTPQWLRIAIKSTMGIGTPSSNSKIERMRQRLLKRLK